MQKIISLKYFVALAVALMFSVATTAFASTDYYEIEIEYEVAGGKTTVEVEYAEEEGDNITKQTYTFFTTDLDDVWEDLADELNLSVGDIEDILDGEYGDDNNDDVSRDDADESLDEAIYLLGEAEYEIEDIDDEDDKTAAGKLFNDAENLVDDAEEAFGLGKYGDAKDYADDAIDILEDIIDGDYYGDDEDEEEEEEDKEDAEDAIEDAQKAIDEAEEYIETLQDKGKDTDDLEEYLAIAKGYLENAEEALDDDDYDEAEEWAEKAENKVEKTILNDGDDDKYYDDDKVYVCHTNNKTLKISVASLDDHLDHGDTKGKCNYDDDNYEKKDWKKEYDYSKKKDYNYSDFGKSTDNEELRAQLELLIDLLIELLRARL